MKAVIDLLVNIAPLFALVNTVALYVIGKRQKSHRELAASAEQHAATAAKTAQTAANWSQENNSAIRASQQFWESRLGKISKQADKLEKQMNGD